MEDKRALNQLIGSNIKREREKAGMTQEKLAEIINLGVKSLSAVERGTVGASVSTLRRICRALGISSDALLFGDQPENDIGALIKRLERLTPRQCKLASDMLYTLLEAFSLKE